jgi:elongator complex protein 3
MMKLYPTLVVRETALMRLFEAGRYSPYDLETAVDLLAEMKRYVPRWHRIMRIMREIPEKDIRAGPNAGNLRELVLRKARDKGHGCVCIRCREVAMDRPPFGGLQAGCDEREEDDALHLVREEYVASGGTEVFASFEFARSGRLAAFVRMREPSKNAHRDEMRGSCVVRELKVYGRVVPVGARSQNAWQHRGLGRALLEEMERVAKEELDARRLLVTSAVGTREYYRKLGYEKVGPYVGKPLS